MSGLLVSALFVACVVALPDGPGPRTDSPSTSSSSLGFEQTTAPFTDHSNGHNIAPRNINDVYGTGNTNNPFGSSSTYTRAPPGTIYSSGSKQPDTPIPQSHTIHRPSSSTRQNVDIKILPLPIPIGLPTPLFLGPSAYHPNNYGHDYNRQYESYPNYAPNPYDFGLFSGFGNDIVGPTLKKVALGQKVSVEEKRKLHSHHLRGVGGSGGHPLSPSFYGNDPIRASILASRSNPLIHLLAAPYIKNIKENNGKDLPTLDDLKILLEKSSFGLSDIDEDLGIIEGNQ